jgi:uncharacterized protein (DUF1499 family)
MRLINPIQINKPIPNYLEDSKLSITLTQPNLSNSHDNKDRSKRNVEVLYFMYDLKFDADIVSQIYQDIFNKIKSNTNKPFSLNFKSIRLLYSIDNLDFDLEFPYELLTSYMDQKEHIPIVFNNLFYFPKFSDDFLIRLKYNNTNIKKTINAYSSGIMNTKPFKLSIYNEFETVLIWNILNNKIQPTFYNVLSTNILSGDKEQIIKFFDHLNLKINLIHNF